MQAHSQAEVLPDVQVLLSLVVAFCRITRIRHSGAHTVKFSAASTAWSVAVSFGAPHAPENASSQQAELGEADFMVPACRKVFRRLTGNICTRKRWKAASALIKK